MWQSPASSSALRSKSGLGLRTKLREARRAPCRAACGNVGERGSRHAALRRCSPAIIPAKACHDNNKKELDMPAGLLACCPAPCPARVKRVFKRSLGLRGASGSGHECDTGSILDNIRYGRPSASTLECHEASRLANAHREHRDDPYRSGITHTPRGGTR